LSVIDFEHPLPSLSILDHGLAVHFEALARINSTEELLQTALYKQIEPEVNRVLNLVAEESFASRTIAGPARDSIYAVAWNIERGIRLDGIIEALRTRPGLAHADVLLLTELDYGMARTQNRFIAREIASALEMNYVFAPSYINLAKGSGLEAHAEGENQQALHGNAVVARYPLVRAHSLALPNGKDKMRGKEKRLGSQRAVVADMRHPSGEVRLVSIHLDAHSTQKHRHRQMRILLDHLETLSPKLPVVIGGDWNTTTYNSSRAVFAILGFFRRVLMGVSNILDNHYPHPYRWFERHLFRELESRGFDFRESNEIGAGTLHYDVRDLSHNTNMADWVPGWCFWFLNKALEKHNGRASLKLDWFAARGVNVDKHRPPRVIGNLADEKGPLSDHDAIALAFRL
jgi:endonuclease/exonuclease/phosphatase family metal-dependent hydrolase